MVMLTCTSPPGYAIIAEPKGEASNRGESQ